MLGGQRLQGDLLAVRKDEQGKSEEPLDVMKEYGLPSFCAPSKQLLAPENTEVSSRCTS